MTYDYDVYETREMAYPDADTMFFTRVVPGIAIGLAIWLFGILYIGPYIFVNIPGFFFIGLIAYIVLWIATIIVASKAQNNSLAFLLFLGTSALSGVLTTPIFVWGAAMVGSLDLGFQLGAVSVGGALTGVLVMGFAGYRQRHNRELAASLGSFLFWGVLATIGFEFLTFFLFPGQYFMILFFTSIAMIWLTLIYAFYDGMRLRDMLDSGLWMYAVVMFFLDIIILAVRIFIILVTIFASDR
ncbi:MAG: hypothetical protein ACXAEU_14810 [Candidatus Hodarchaeales archaeon]|jgi:hypothetical protein